MATQYQPELFDSGRLSSPPTQGLRRLECSPQPDDLIGKLATASRQRADALTHEADRIVVRSFRQSFPSDLIQELGLVLVATGSYGRQLLVSGRSDIDLSLYATKVSFDRLSQIQRSDLETALSDFLSSIDQAFQAIDLKVDSRIQCVELSDLESRVHACSSVRIGSAKEAAEALTKFVSMRPLAGVETSFDAFQAASKAVLGSVISNEELLAESVRILCSAGQKIIGDHHLQLTVQNIKSQPLTLASCAIALIELLKTETNRERLNVLRAEIAERCYFLAMVREALPSAGQTLNPQTNLTLPFSISRIYGPQPGILPLAYKASAWMARAFGEILAEAESRGLVRLQHSQNTAVLPKREFTDISEVRDLFALSGNVSPYLELGLSRGSFANHLPELASLDGVPDTHFYQRYTLGEHAVQATAVLDKFFRGEGDPRFVKLAAELTRDERVALILATTLHDCGKPEEIRVGGEPEYHAEIGSRYAVAAASRLELSLEQVRTVGALVKNHLWLRQNKQVLRERIAAGAASIPEELRSSRMISMLSLLAFADEAASDPENWNSLRANHLHELCYSYTCVLENKPIALRHRTAADYAQFLFVNHREKLGGSSLIELQDHLSHFSASHLGAPPESVCEFFRMAKAEKESGQPQVQFIPHQLMESDNSQDLFKFDLLVVGADRKYLASNIVKILTEGGFTIHTASFSVTDSQKVFNRFIITSATDRSVDIPRLREAILAVNRNESLHVPKVSGFYFESGVKIAVTAREPTAGETPVTEVSLASADQRQLLLRFLVGLNTLGLNLIGAEITTFTGQGGKKVATNQFYVTASDGRDNQPDLRSLKAALVNEFKDPE